MQDLKEIKQLCQAHIAGEIDQETYRSKRAEILDLLVANGVPAHTADTTLQNEPAIKDSTQSKDGFFTNCSGTKLIICSLLGLGILGALAVVGFIYLT